MHARAPQLLRLAAVPAAEGGLAADAAQHPQPRDDVGGPVGQLALQVAVGPLAPVQRPQQASDEGGHHTSALPTLITSPVLSSLASVLPSAAACAVMS